MRSPAVWGGGKASVPSPFAAIVPCEEASTRFYFPPQDSRGSDCPGQKTEQKRARSSRPLCSLRLPSVTSVLKREPSNQSVLPMPASLMSAACLLRLASGGQGIAVAVSADAADL